MTRRLGLKALSAASLAALAASLAGFASPALAHPHVWVTAKAEIVFADGRVTGIRHLWTFDEAYTAYVTQGLDRDNDGKLTPEELQPLADENTNSLEEFGYFTTVKVNGRKQAFDPPREPRMVMEKSQVAMSYFLPLKVPASASGAVAMEIDDPTFFVYFSLAEGRDSIALANAPQGCVTSIAKAKALDTAMQQILQAEGALPLSLSSAQYANKAIVACP
jgi:ABC-type uncharacterized transport system substrate-binding protein